MTDRIRRYTAHKPPPPPSREQLRARIPGWGADLDPADRPSVPKLQFPADLTGAHWEFPERQPEKWPRERSIEHAFLTPVFGTAQPPQGALRRDPAALLRPVQRGPGGALAAAHRWPTGSTRGRATCASFADAAPGQPDHRDRRAERGHARRALVAPGPEAHRRGAPGARPGRRGRPVGARGRRAGARRAPAARAVAERSGVRDDPVAALALRPVQVGVGTAEQLRGGGVGQPPRARPPRC